MTQAEIHKQEEVARLAFVLERDGMEGAIRFARQIISQYRNSLKQRNKAGHRAGYGLAFRLPLVASCVVARRFLLDNDSDVY